MVFEEVRSDQCNMTRAPGQKVAVDLNHGLPAGVLGPVALIGPHLLEKEAAVEGVRAKNGPRRSLPASDTEKRRKGTNRKTDD